MNKEKLKEFLLFIQEKTKIKSLELIEKDFYLSLFLSKLNLEECVFKGGTCLAKVYLDYHRLSEDLDFTFKDQKLFDGRSAKQIKRMCKEKINLFGKQLEELRFDFVFDKSNRKYVEIGSSNKLITFKVWYDSLFTEMPSFVKIQINFVDLICFPVKRKIITPLLKGKILREEKIYFSDFFEFYKKKKIFVYDIKEIVTEKIRCLLTRRVIKTRDVIDLFFIYKKYRISPESLIKESKEKLMFAINKYKKYKENFILIKRKTQDFEISYDKVKEIVIEEIKKEDFNKFILNLKDVLDKIILLF